MLYLYTNVDFICCKMSTVIQACF